MYPKLSNNLQAALETGNQEAAVLAMLQANRAMVGELITVQEYNDIRADFNAAYPDLN